MKHTPGQLEVGEYKHTIWKEGGKSILGEAFDHTVSTEEAEANALLWSKAPLLLEALKNITTRYEFTIYALETGDIPHLYKEELKEAQQAIKEATQ